MVRSGQVPGAVRARGRYFVLRAHVGELITDMSGGDRSLTRETVDVQRAG
jgi:hypothetical protein